ncbi:unnamed protein product [Periconia digitata]|uniref:Secreted protein n=1 Tax=Periconia digitata TaxID=1303443 RepID=A0A9W4UU62_9PLEO|nr:unnamed protein product [Periconia digitata]
MLPIAMRYSLAFFLGFQSLHCRLDSPANLASAITIRPHCLLEAPIQSSISRGCGAKALKISVEIPQVSTRAFPRRYRFENPLWPSLNDVMSFEAQHIVKKKSGAICISVSFRKLRDLGLLRPDVLYVCGEREAGRRAGRLTSISL